MASSTGDLRAGIDLGGTKINVVVVDGRFKVLGEARRPTPGTGGPVAIIQAMARALQDAVHEAGVDSDRVLGIGVGAPGAADPAAGTLAHAGNLNGWEKSYPLSAKLGALAGKPVFLGNDVQVAVRGEYELGAGRGRRSMLGVWWGTGVGGGLILAGKPWIGAGAAGEIGHMVVKQDGARCSCGRRGCLEAYAGRAAMEGRARRAARQGKKTILFDLMEERKKTRLSSSVWARALAKKDPLATRLVDRAIEMLGTGIASAINLLDLETIVIGGGLGTRLGAPYVERIATAMVPHLKVPDRPRQVLVAALGDLSGALGASLLVPGPGTHQEA
jgi:glucokinase